METANIVILAGIGAGVLSIGYKMVTALMNAILHFGKGVQDMTFYRIDTIFTNPELAKDKDGSVRIINWVV